MKAVRGTCKKSLSGKEKWVESDTFTVATSSRVARSAKITACCTENGKHSPSSTAQWRGRGITQPFLYGIQRLIRAIQTVIRYMGVYVLECFLVHRFGHLMYC